MRDLDNTKHTDSEENATISSIKNALMWIVEEWVGFDVPEEDSEDYATWMIMLETVENFKTIDDLPEALDFFGMDYLDFIVHVFTPETREFYRLDNLWKQAPAETLNEAGEVVPEAAGSVAQEPEAQESAPQEPMAD